MPLVYMMLGGIAFIMVVVVIVVAANDKGHRRVRPQETEAVDEALNADAALGEDQLTADDLDFWNMYKKDEKKVSDNAVIKDKSYEERLKELEEKEAEEAKANDLSEGGTKTKVIRPDGTEQWIMINPFIEKNTYKEEGFVYEDPMMKYFADGKKISYQGVMLDETDKTVDFALLHQAGVEFVMLRIGYRGYESGKISEDTLFEDHLQSAVKAEMMVGVYFESAATNNEEASEEAEFVTRKLAQIASDKIRKETENNSGLVTTEGQTAGDDTTKTAENAENTDSSATTEIKVDENGQAASTKVTGADAQQGEQQEMAAPPEGMAYIKNEDITYPVAIKMGQPANHSARTDNLTKTTVSGVAAGFLSGVKASGYQSIVWGDKYWLLRRMDLTQLPLGTDILLEQEEELPDYPYQFAIWQYKSDGKLSGLNTQGRMLTSFVDYQKQ